ncbi:ral guanine nucleotide dissociation stimulator-like 1 isoform X1 [Erpetoichthys calabaricus]|uniref:Ral guanine nucleotide dissociation stimulator-like 1 n=1 Tax=Erpetoichthys calabaricus TaxID=27687 RepID=A0A8C4XHC3_ERPCA|nr:ral guanine nucleotide dissociation stimulator-like 1 isoform X1 [Erpetoichthys calabaricus]
MFEGNRSLVRDIRRSLSLELNLESRVFLRSFRYRRAEEEHQNPVQEWGEEVEDDAVYSITLRRIPVKPSQTADSSCDCGFVQYRTTKERTLKAGTLDKLVAHLLEPSADPTFTRVFLSMYQAFTDTKTVLELLLDRDSRVGVNGEENGLWTDSGESDRTLKRLLKLWLDEYREDFHDPPSHACLQALCAYLRQDPRYREVTLQAEAVLQRFRQDDCCRTEAISFKVGADEVDVCNSSERPDILSLPSRDIAEQFTIMDADLFAKVHPFQCLGCVWSQRDKKEKKHRAPTIKATIQQFNRVTNCVIGTLLSDPGNLRPLCRARIVEKWIQVAQECMLLRNFTSLRAILSALQSNPVYRLKRTWAAVSRDSLVTLDQLSKFFDDENCPLTSKDALLKDPDSQSECDANSKCPKRSSLCQQADPCAGTVPYLGTYLTILTMLDTALPDTLEGGLINFEKRRREFEILSWIKQLQVACCRYELSLHPEIAVWLQSYRMLSEQESHELSREVEPPLDPCPGSPRLWSHRKLVKKLSGLIMGSEGSASRVVLDQVSISLSGSSGSEVEDVSAPQSPVRKNEKLLDSPCQEGSDDVFVGPESPGPSPSLSPVSAKLEDKQRSSSSSSLPVYNQQIDDSCIVRISMGWDNGNLYKSILLTSQDKTAQVIQRALEKHNVESTRLEDFQLCQVIGEGRELVIPDKANVFYAMCTSANYDFILRCKGRDSRAPPSPSTGRSYQSWLVPWLTASKE